MTGEDSRAARGHDAPAMLPVGEPAPDFTVRDHHGALQTLSSRRGKRVVLLVFFPYAFTGVCAGELAELSDRTDVWRDGGVDVLALSCDAVPTLSAFAADRDLTVPLLSDHWPHGAVASAYRVFDRELGVATRGSFVVDRAGVIRATMRSAMPHARDVDDYLAAVTSL